ncbi:MAG: hypothetical protein N3D15_05820 [Syntrophorhabdaceae bacterium]|nr:hypothetical protein [Syntrophorhabdaceae bacterium]
MDKRCIYYATCPILTGKAEIEEVLLDNYRITYCEAGRDAWVLCRRYQVREMAGRCPLEILPDTPYDVEEIIERYDL